MIDITYSTSTSTLPEPNRDDACIPVFTNGAGNARNVLDFGCAWPYGRFTAFAENPMAHVTAFDISAGSHRRVLRASP